MAVSDDAQRLYTNARPAGHGERATCRKQLKERNIKYFVNFTSCKAAIIKMKCWKSMGKELAVREIKECAVRNNGSDYERLGCTQHFSGGNKGEEK